MVMKTVELRNGAQMPMAECGVFQRRVQFPAGPAA